MWFKHLFNFSLLEWIVAWSENVIGKESIVNHCCRFDLTLIHFFWFQALGCPCKFSSNSSSLCSVSASEFFSQQVICFFSAKWVFFLSKWVSEKSHPSTNIFFLSAAATKNSKNSSYLLSVHSILISNLIDLHLSNSIAQLLNCPTELHSLLSNQRRPQTKVITSLPCSYHELNMTSNNPAGLMYLFQIVFALYMLVTTIVLINLLIAMMSDTYQRIQVFFAIFLPEKTSFISGPIWCWVEIRIVKAD